MESAELTKNLLSMRQQYRIPEFVLIGADSKQPETDIVITIHEQNDIFQRSSIEFRTSFADEKGRNVMLVVDERPYK